MNECEYARRLSAYYDGEVSPQERAAIEAHLPRCDACAAELERLGRLSHLVAAAEGSALSPEARARLHRGVDALPTAELGRLAKVFLAAAAAVLVVCSIWLWQANGGQESAESIPVWETVASHQQTLATGADERLARWMVQDLERKNGHE